MLPHLDGLEICRRVRANEQTANIPIIMLTARAEESERIVGLELGADDYLAKPFSPNELVARVRALLRRANRTAPVAKDARVRINCRRHRASRRVAGRRDRGADGRRNSCCSSICSSTKGRVLSRDLLLTDVWGYRYTGGTRTVDVHVRRLREKLPLLAEAIVTVKQFGYKLLDPEPSP
jgi:DNA-binding response OmpR family regulator